MSVLDIFWCVFGWAMFDIGYRLGKKEASRRNEERIKR